VAASSRRLGACGSEAEAAAVEPLHPALYYSSGDPAAPSSGWIPGVVTVSGQTNLGDQNLDPTNPAHPVIAYTNTVGKWTFFFSNVGALGQRWFAQMVVEELVNGVPTGRWSASRGTWIEVAQ